MFYGYEDTDDSEVYEDDLYHEESSSEQSVDSEVEFHLYSQIHYSQNLGEISTVDVTEEADVAGVKGQSSALTETLHEDKNVIELPSYDIQVSDGSEVIVLSDTPDEESVYKSKAKKSTSSLAQGKVHTHLGSSIPNHATDAECDILYPAGSDTEIPRQRKSARGKLTSVSSVGTHAVQEVMVIDDSSNEEEESMISESDDVESWMLLGCSADDKDEDIILNLEGCGTPVNEAARSSWRTGREHERASLPLQRGSTWTWICWLPRRAASLPGQPGPQQVSEPDGKRGSPLSSS